MKNFQFSKKNSIQPNRLGNIKGKILYSIVKSSMPTNIIETGVATGYSTSIILMALKKNNYGLLKGLNFLVKDMCNVKRFKTSCGNPDFFDICKPANDYAPFLKGILNEGAKLNGITICDEFFYSLIV